MMYDKQVVDLGYIPVRLTAIKTNKPPNQKKVSFKPSVTVQPVERVPGREEVKSLYYSKEDLKTFWLEVNAIYALTKCLPDQVRSRCEKRDDLFGLETDPALRGLEPHLNKFRVQNKVMVQRALIKFHRKLSANCTQTQEEKAVRLAAMSAKLSQRSKLVALRTARLDTQQSYQQDGPPLSTLAPEGDSKGKRRRVTFDLAPLDAARPGAASMNTKPIGGSRSRRRRITFD